jgi:anti-sigma B factor antagonist
MSSQLLQASITRVHNTHVVRFRGEVDMSTAALFEQTISAATAARTTSITIDLTEVTFFGATGAALLVAAARGHCQTLGIAVRLVPSEAVLSALRLRGLDRAFDITDARPATCQRPARSSLTSRSLSSTPEAQVGASGWTVSGAARLDAGRVRALTIGNWTDASESEAG